MSSGRLQDVIYRIREKNIAVNNEYTLELISPCSMKTGKPSEALLR